MKIIGLLALVLLSLLGYSVGTVLRAGRSSEPKPRLADLVLIVILWGGALYFGLAGDLKHAILIPISIFIAFLAGIAAASLRRERQAPAPLKKAAPAAPASGIRNLRRRWLGFSRRMGSFQTRILLSFFYFIVVSPFALVVKSFSDPLRLKHRAAPSFWLERGPSSSDLEESKRQF